MNHYHFKEISYVKKSQKSKPFAHDSEFFHTERIEGPLSENLKTALQAVQKAKACKHKVPVVEIEEDGRYFLLIPRQRLTAVASRLERSLPTWEERFLGIATRQRPISRRR